MLTRPLFVQHPAAGAVGVQAGHQQVHPVDHIIINQYTLFFYSYPPHEIGKAEWVPTLIRLFCVAGYD